MPFQFTKGTPDIALVMKTGDPRHCTRAPRDNKKRDIHVHAPFPKDFKKGWKIVSTWEDPIHKSINTVYELTKSYPNNCLPLACNDPRIEWLYETNGPRQSARPYISESNLSDAEKKKVMVNFYKVAQDMNDPSKIRMETLSITGTKEGPCGDIIARLNHAVHNKDLKEKEELMKILQHGKDVCVYLK